MYAPAGTRHISAARRFATLSRGLLPLTMLAASVCKLLPRDTLHTFMLPLGQCKERIFHFKLRQLSFRATGAGAAPP